MQQLTGQTGTTEFKMYFSLECICLFLLLVRVHGYQQEHRCSKFNFEEKVLEKMVRVEHKMELMEEENEKLKAKLSSDLERSKEIQTRLEENQRETLQGFTDQRSYSFSAFWVDDTSPSTGDTLVFTDTQLDEDGVYNNETGKFMTPVTGIYTFSSTICTWNGKHVRVDIVVDDKMIGRVSSHHTGWSGCSSGTATAKIEKGSKVWMKVIYASSGEIFDNNKTYTINSFSGHLLQKLAG